MSPQEAKAYLESFINYEHSLKNVSKKKFKLDRVKHLLHLLDNPQDSLKIVHVAGSKGKGSTCAVIASILKEAQYKVGLYTSPHINNYYERIRILSHERNDNRSSGIFNDTITDTQFAEAVGDLKPVIEKAREYEEMGSLSFFEIFTVLALYFFKKENVDVVVLETGLGGRLDATNVVDACLCVITSISLEHTSLLGNSLEKIAKEKAGIIKNNKQKVVIAPQRKSVKKVFLDHCMELDIQPTFIDDQTESKQVDQTLQCQIFDVKTVQYEYKNLQTPLLGLHQLENIVLAINAIECLQSFGLKIDSAAISKGLKNIYWPGRLEMFQKKALTILDSAHNQESTRRLVDTIEDILPNTKVALVIGASDDKDRIGMGEELNRIVNHVIATKADHPRAIPFQSEELKEMFPEKKCFNTDNVREALNLAYRECGEEDVVLVTGSVFVVSEARGLCIN